MKNYIKEHNLWIEDLKNIIANEQPLPDHALEFHKMKVDYLQHERLIHLLVMMMTIALTVAFFMLSLFMSQPLIYVLLAIFIILSLFYIRYYYLLENTVQEWYRITEMITDYIFR